MCLDFILPKLDLFLLFLLSNLIQNADYWIVICTPLSLLRWRLQSLFKRRQGKTCNSSKRINCLAAVCLCMLYCTWALNQTCAPAAELCSTTLLTAEPAAEKQKGWLQAHGCVNRECGTVLGYSWSVKYHLWRFCTQDSCQWGCQRNSGHSFGLVQFGLFAWHFARTVGVPSIWIGL